MAKKNPASSGDKRGGRGPSVCVSGPPRHQTRGAFLAWTLIATFACDLSEEPEDPSPPLDWQAVDGLPDVELAVLHVPRDQRQS